jgi:uncharacterized protein YecT (DUF1311 family)
VNFFSEKITEAERDWAIDQYPILEGYINAGQWSYSRNALEKDFRGWRYISWAVSNKILYLLIGIVVFSFSFFSAFVPSIIFLIFQWICEKKFENYKNIINKHKIGSLVNIQETDASDGSHKEKVTHSKAHDNKVIQEYSFIDISGERILTNDSYKIYLVKKYKIEKNDALSKFIFNNKLFDSIDDALLSADSLESQLNEEVNKISTAPALKPENKVFKTFQVKSKNIDISTDKELLINPTIDQEQSNTNLGEGVKTTFPTASTTEVQDPEKNHVQSEGIYNNSSGASTIVQEKKTKSKPILILLSFSIITIGAFLIFILEFPKTSEVYSIFANNSVKVFPSFDCTNAKSTNEKLICSDNQLAAADNELNEIFHFVKAKVENSPEFKSDAVAAFKQRESNCTDKKCLLEWYANRKVFYQDIINGAEENCQYFLGEVPYDKEREAFLLENIEKFCPPGTKPSWQ